MNESRNLKREVNSGYREMNKYRTYRGDWMDRVQFVREMMELGNVIYRKKVFKHVFIYCSDILSSSLLHWLWITL